MTPLVEVLDLRKHFPIRYGPLRRRTGSIRALDGVDLEIDAGECLALVGESGSGKTTLGRCILRLIEPTGGEVRFAGENLLAWSERQLRSRRRHFQMVFQDAYGSLNPRLSVARILSEPLEVHRTVPRAERGARVRELLELVGLEAEAASRYPHQFSGGQRQRIGIARALAPRPRFLVADEPVSALDVSVRGQIVNLLIELRERFRIAILFIAHDLAVVEQIADRVAVLYLGRVSELVSAARLIEAAQHPYTVSLLSAVPTAAPGRRSSRIVLTGEPPNAADPPSGCRFHPRCPIAEARCRLEEPELQEVAPGHLVACHLPGQLLKPLPEDADNGTF